MSKFIGFQVIITMAYEIFAIIQNSKIDQLLNIFNSINPRIQFTHEIEQNNSIIFLDISITRENNK